MCGDPTYQLDDTHICKWPLRNRKVWFGLIVCSVISSNNRTVLPQSQDAIQAPKDAHPNLTAFTPVQRSPEGSSVCMKVRSDHGKSRCTCCYYTVLPDCPCVQTEACNAINDTEEKLFLKKSFLKVFFYVAARKRKTNWEVLFLYRSLLHCAFFC